MQETCAVCEFPLPAFEYDSEQGVTTATDVATLKEKVENHIKFFWVVVGFGFVWLGAISLFLWNIHGQLANVGNANLVRELESPKSQEQLQANLGMVSAEIQTATANGKKPDEKKIATLSTALSKVVKRDPDLPEAWQAAARLVSYESSVKDEKLHGLPLCDIDNVKVSYRPTMINGQEIVFVGYFFSNCTLELERLPARSGIVRPTYLDNGIVVYHSGPLAQGNIAFRFTNCRFEFDVRGVPSKPIQDMLISGLQQPDIDTTNESIS
jgi:hypothetical protein